MNKKLKFELNTSIPVSFSSFEQMDDPRFLRGKIWVCHVGQNLNNSIFSKDVITKAIPSLANIPVLGFIKVDEENKDFMGHEQRLVFDEEDGFRIEYMGHMYGIVPESNNAKFETKLDDNGIEREYLTVEVILHTKFKNSIDIITKNGVVKHSMELEPNSIQGNFDKKTKLFEFTDFKFEGLCLLGEDVKPAMSGSVLELFSQFNRYSVTDEMSELLKEFNSYFSNKQKEEFEKEGGKNPVDEKLELITSYTELTDEDTKDIKEQLDNYTVEDLKVKLDEIQASKNVERSEENPETQMEAKKVEDTPEGAIPVVEDQEEEQAEEKDDKEETPDGNPNEPDPVTDFALTVEQKRSMVIESLNGATYVDAWGDTTNRFYYIDMDEARIYAMDAMNDWKAVGINYNMNGDAVSIDFDSVKIIKFMPVDLEEGQETNFSASEILNTYSEKTRSREEEKYQTSLQNYEAEMQKKDFELTQTLEQLSTIQSKFEEVNRLYSEKLSQENQEKLETLYETFSKELSPEEINEVKSKNENSSYEDIELKLYAIVGMKKAKFSIQTPKATTPIIDLTVDSNEEPEIVKSYDRLAQKYLKNKKQTGGNK